MIQLPLSNHQLLDEGNDGEDSDDESYLFREERLYHRKMGEHAVNKIIHPSPTSTSKEIPAIGSLQQYLEPTFCSSLSELWAFLQGKHDAVHGWRMHMLEKWKLTFKLNEREGVIDKIEVEEGVLKDLDDCVYHLVVWRGHLCLTTKVCIPENLKKKRRVMPRYETIEKLVIKEGSDLSQLGFRYIDGSDKDTAFSLGYVKPFMEEFAVLMRFIGNLGSCPKILNGVADISSRIPFNYSNEDRSTVVECNRDQESIIRNLRYNVEAVQGPPGAFPVFVNNFDGF